MQKIYIELILLDNFCMDFILLYISMRLSEKRVRLGKVSLGALIGAVYSAIAVAVPFFNYLPVKIVFSFIMCIPLMAKGWMSRLRMVGFLYLVSFLLSGCIYFIAHWLGGEMRGGYINVPMLRYILIGGSLGILLIEWVLRFSYPKIDVRYELNGHILGEAFSLIGYLDTGNALKDAAGNGVIVAKRSSVIIQLSTHAQELIQEPYNEVVPVREFLVSTVSGEGSLIGFMPDELTVKDHINTYTAKAYIALSDDMETSETDAVLGQNIRLY